MNKLLANSDQWKFEGIALCYTLLHICVNLQCYVKLSIGPYCTGLVENNPNTHKKKSGKNGHSQFS